MRYLALFVLLIWSTTGMSQASRNIVAPNSWIVVIGAVKECPQYEYQILDAQFLHDRKAAFLAGTSMNRLIGLSGTDIENALKSRSDLFAHILPESLKVLVYQAALPPPVIKRLMVQATSDPSSDCQEPSYEYQIRPRRGPYRGDGPDDISIESVKSVA